MTSISGTPARPRRWPERTPRRADHCNPSRDDPTDSAQELDLASLARDRRPYETRDGHICVLVYNDKHWRSFFEAIGQPEVFAQDARFGSQGKRLENIDHVYGFFGEIFRTRSTSERADIPAARMYSIEDILADPHLEEPATSSP